MKECWNPKCTNKLPPNRKYWCSDRCNWEVQNEKARVLRQVKKIAKEYETQITN